MSAVNIKDLKTFEDRYNYDVKKLGIVEKKGKFDYLSWAYAQKLAKIFDDKSTWRIIKNNDDTFIHNGFLLLEMTFLGQTEQHFFPILDNYNRPIKNPNPFQVNTSQMRGFAKLFAMVSGFGLSLYANEDLAYLDQENSEQSSGKPKQHLTTEEKKQRMIEYINKNCEDYQKEIDKYMLANSTDNLAEIPYEEIKELAPFIKNGIEEKKGA